MTRKILQNRVEDREEVIQMLVEGEEEDQQVHEVNGIQYDTVREVELVVVVVQV